MSATGARVLLSGYYGFDNFGDDAILATFVEQWRSRRAADRITVLSATPAQTAATYGVGTLPRMGHSAIVRALKDADVFVSGGGGLLQSSTSLRSLIYYTGLIAEAKAAGLPAAIFGQGIGPLGFTAKHIVRRSCAKVDLAIVRDEASAALLRDLIPQADIRVGSDPVFLADVTVDDDAQRTLAAEGITGTGPLAAVIVRPARVLDRIAPDIARAVDLLTQRYGVQVIFIPFQRPQDVEAAISVIRRCRASPVLVGGGFSLRTMAALIARCTVVVGMRLHSLIMAARLGVPFLAVPYDPKIAALSEALRYPLPALQSGSADEAVDALWSRRAALSATLRDGASAQAALAAASFDWLATFVEGAVS